MGLSRCAKRIEPGEMSDSATWRAVLRREGREVKETLPEEGEGR